MNPKTEGRTYYPALDVLRGIAISLVVLYHNFDCIKFFRFGWLGVDLFFVLSGFLITDLLLTARAKGSFLKNFYIRRVLRIFPLYYITLIGFYLLAPHIFSQKDPSSTYYYYEQNKFWFWTYLQNWLFVEKGNAPMPYLSHFWSLAVEEQFYIFWPLVLFFVKDLTKLKHISIVLIITALIIRLYTRLSFPDEVEKYYCSTLTRMDSLLIGGLLAIRMKEGKVISARFIKMITGVCVLLFCSVLVLKTDLNQNNLLFSTVGYTCFALLFASFIYLFITSQSALFEWLKSLTFLNYIGKISYGIYVYHIPIYLLLGTKFTSLLAEWIGGGNTEVYISLLSIVLTVGASTLSFYLLEKPILNLKRYFP